MCFCAPVTLVLFCGPNYRPWGLYTILSLMYVMPGAVQENINLPDCYELYRAEGVDLLCTCKCYCNMTCKTLRYSAYHMSWKWNWLKVHELFKHTCYLCRPMGSLLPSKFHGLVYV